MWWTRKDGEAGSFSTASAPRGGRVRRAFRAIFLQLLIIVATLVTMELFLRFIDLRELREAYGRGYAVVHRYDPELGWLPIPNTVATFTGSRTIGVRHNSLGLRDIEHDRMERPTVLFVGDSFVWGYDVEESERFTELLRAELSGINIVNAGVNGYGTDQEYLLLNRIWSAVRPDVVVLNFTLVNDRNDNTSNMIYGGYYKPYLAQAADSTWRFLGQPVPKSRQTYFIEDPLVKNLWLARVAVTSYIYVRHPKIAVLDPTEQLVKMMRDLVEFQRGQVPGRVAISRRKIAVIFAGAEYSLHVLPRCGLLSDTRQSLDSEGPRSGGRPSQRPAVCNGRYQVVVLTSPLVEEVSGREPINRANFHRTHQITFASHPIAGACFVSSGRPVCHDCAFVQSSRQEFTDE